MANPVEEKLMATYGSFMGPHEGDVYTVHDSSGWFHVRADGTPVYQARFALVFGGFREGFTVVMGKGGGFFHVHLDGTPLYEARFTNLGDFKGGLAAATINNGPWVLINTLGQVVETRQDVAFRHVCQTDAEWFPNLRARCPELCA